ncbi:MAG: HAMP domain-containing sensor histidine kinase [Candidatus Nitrosopolaris sp.]
MVNFSIDKTTLLAIIIPMIALLLVGYVSYVDTIQFIQKDVVDDRLLMDKIQANTPDIQNPQNSMLAPDIRQSEAYVQALTQTIIIASLVAAGLTSVSVFVINHGINKRHLAIERLLQIEVEKRTEQLQIANRQLLAANEQLELHDRMQQDFINIAAHELRTPIQPILGLAQILRTKSKDSMFIDSLDIIVRNAIRLRRLTEDILDVQKIESHTLQLNIESLDLNAFISDVVADYKKQLLNEKKEGISLLTEFNFSKPIVLYADRYGVVRVINNLLNNSVKFTKEGTVVTSVKEGMDQQRHELIVSVKDTGRGIDPDILPKLFSKFVTKSHRGKGLGLYICKAIIEAHDGKIWAENNIVGKGATFSFSLPFVALSTSNRTGH